jgi:HEAT repeat protein
MSTFPRSKRTKITSDELLKQREQDPAYRAQMRKLEEQRVAAAEEYYEAAAPLIAELLSSGFDVKSLDVLTRSNAYKDAVPILLKWLPKITNSRVKESIVRALSVSCVKPAAIPALMAEFRNTPKSENSGLKWAIGNALEVLAGDEIFDDIVELVQDKRHGTARQMLVMALGKMKNPKAVDVLIGLLGDDDVVGHALSSLKKLRAKQARTHIVRLLNHPNAWVRKVAKQALAKIED